MTSKLTLDQVNSLISFQRRYRFNKIEINNINSQLRFYQDCLMSMLSNLVSCNKINIYAGTNTSFMIILDELVSYGTYESDAWNKEMGDDIVWNDLRNLMDNYERFLTIDVKKYKIRLLKLIEESK